ncbi:2605_t:CDS:10 [Entrophospora sp. SA101]|nr:2605_t:CDS:10 [Entrophospora sp. SA101]
MGIPSLLQNLRSIESFTSISKYAGTTVGIDAYSWLHKGASTCVASLVRNKETKRHVDFCLTRVKMLQKFKVRPLLVFDGGYLPAKEFTEKKREMLRLEYRKLGEECIKKGKVLEAKEYFLRSFDITPEIAHQLILALRNAKVDYVVAPYEADAQLAYLEKKKKISAIITEDSDLLVFGCNKVIYKLDQYGNGVEISRDKFGDVEELNLLGWTDKQFRQMAMLAGCDYLPSIAGMGIKSAYKYLRMYKSVEKVIDFLKLDGKSEIPPDYINNFKRAETAFLYQRVFDIDSQSLVTLNPIPDHLKNEVDAKELNVEVSIGIANGEINPITKELIDSTKQINNTTTTDLIDKVEKSDNVNTKKHKRNITDKNIVPNKEHKRMPIASHNNHHKRHVKLRSDNDMNLMLNRFDSRTKKSFSCLQINNIINLSKTSSLNECSHLNNRSRKIKLDSEMILTKVYSTNSDVQQTKEQKCLLLFQDKLKSQDEHLKRITQGWISKYSRKNF